MAVSKKNRNFSLYSAERALHDEIKIDHDKEEYQLGRGEENGARRMTFAYCWEKLAGLAHELHAKGYAPLWVPDKAALYGTEEAYRRMRGMCYEAETIHDVTGETFDCMLHPLLIGLEGRRVFLELASGAINAYWIFRRGRALPYHSMHLRPGTGGRRVRAESVKRVLMVPDDENAKWSDYADCEDN